MQLVIVKMPYGESKARLKGIEEALKSLEGDFTFIVIHDCAVDEIQFEYPKNAACASCEAKLKQITVG